MMRGSCLSSGAHLADSVFTFHISRFTRTMKKLQVLGSGCPKCKKLAKETETAAKALGIEYELEKVTDINQIMSFGVVMTPALAVDGEVKVVGKVPSVDDIKTMIA